MLDIKKSALHMHTWASYQINHYLGPATWLAKFSMKASRNLSKCSPPIKASAYAAVVAWDQYQLNNIQALEKFNVKLPMAIG